MVRLARARGAAAPRGTRDPLISRELTRRLAYAPLALAGLLLAADLVSYQPGDASFDTAAGGPTANLLGPVGADLADLAIQSIGLGAWVIALLVTAAGVGGLLRRPGGTGARRPPMLKAIAAALGVLALAAAFAAPAPPVSWPLSAGLGGMAGDTLLSLMMRPLALVATDKARWLAGGLSAVVGLLFVAFALDAVRGRLSMAPAGARAAGRGRAAPAAAER
ncbi:MAG: cell division protein FtsK, partial [Caulobacteraceae bacterium]|nr:cell division protein FtsK [Caulobacteraceae bacterium]